MNVFLFAANAVLPIVILVLVGYFLKQIKLFDENYFRLGNKLVFRVCLPVMLFFSIYNVETIKDINWTPVVFAIIVTFALFGFGFVGALFVKDKRQKGVIWQNFYRANNAIIGIPLAVALGGEEALPVVSILSAFCVIAYNALATISLSLYTEESGKSSFSGMLKKIFLNPLIIAILAGLVVVVIRGFIPQNAQGLPLFTIKDNLPFVYSALQMISNMTTPISLIVLGGLFTFSAVKELKNQIIFGTVARLIFAPIIGLGAALLTKNIFGFGAPEFAAFISMFCPSAAVSGLAMAAEMNNDETLAGQLVVWTTVLSVFTIYFTTVVLKLLEVI